MTTQFAAIIDAVSERDRAWFEAHPRERRYLRPYVPGEFPLDGRKPPSQESWVLVTCRFPGFRTRESLEMMLPCRTGSGHIVIYGYADELDDLVADAEAQLDEADEVKGKRRRVKALARSF